MKKIKCIGCKKMKKEKDFRIGEGIKYIRCNKCREERRYG